LRGCFAQDERSSLFLRGPTGPPSLYQTTGKQQHGVDPANNRNELSHGAAPPPSPVAVHVTAPSVSTPAVQSVFGELKSCIQTSTQVVGFGRSSTTSGMGEGLGQLAAPRPSKDSVSEAGIRSDGFRMNPKVSRAPVSDWCAGTVQVFSRPPAARAALRSIGRFAMLRSDKRASQWLLPSAVSALLVACGGGGSQVDAGNPLEGSWGGDGTLLGQAELPSPMITNSLTFGGDGTLAGTESGSTVDVAPSEMIYNCRYNATFTGTWSSVADAQAGTILTINWTRHPILSGCTNFIPGEMPSSTGVDEFAATVSGTTLTLTRRSGSGMSGAMFTLTR
jgi:hypothetical protein